MLTRIINLWWRLVFWWKKRTGWVDFGREITVYGTVTELIPPDTDGDRCFNVKLDDGYIDYAQLGGKDMTESGRAKEIHCEIPPWSADWLKETYDDLRVGDRVNVVGAWGFDGVHYKNWSLWIQIPLALWRHQPDFRNGWFEIHPVRELFKVL